MKILFFDIETIPTEESLRYSGLLEAPMNLNEAEIVKRLSLSAATARIFCLAYAVEPPLDSPVEVLNGNEQEILQNFWTLASEANLFVGHNVLDFDLRFIYQRSMIHRIKPSRELPFARFRNSPIFDTMHEWSKWGREHVSLDILSRAMGIPSPKECLDGSQVYPYYRAGRLLEICEYCKCDVDTVREVYRRLTFAAMPDDIAWPNDGGAELSNAFGGAMEIADAQKFLKDNHHGVLVARKKDGSLQMTLVSPVVDGVGNVILTARDSTYKVKNIKRDPRISLLVFGEQFHGSNYIQIDGKAEVIEHPQAMDLVLEWHRQVRGVPEDWDDLRTKIVSEGRIAIRITIAKVGPQNRR